MTSPLIQPQPPRERKTNALTIDFGAQLGDLDIAAEHYRMSRGALVRALLAACVTSDDALFAKVRNAAIADTAEARATALATPVIG